ncbi:MAG: hypothetical protein AAF690_03890 [Acidobacteriota bacterium]
MYMDRILAETSPSVGLLTAANDWFALQKASEQRHASILSTGRRLTSIGDRRAALLRPTPPLPSRR